jgi:alpha-tubulin suppressor-like RCC1 family protein
MDGGHVWERVEANQSHVLALKPGGSLWGWGPCGFGALGQGGIGEYRLVPVELAPGKAWTSIAVGGIHTLAVRDDGTLWACGDNYYGQLGLGHGAPPEPPYSVREFSFCQVGTDDDWVAVAGGMSNSLGLKKDGSLWGWGHNARCDLGVGDTTNKDRPVKIGDGFRAPVR